MLCCSCVNFVVYVAIIIRILLSLLRGSIDGLIDFGLRILSEMIPVRKNFLFTL